MTAQYTLLKQQSLSHQVLLHCPSLGSIVIKEGLTPRGQRQEPGVTGLKCQRLVSI